MNTGIDIDKFYGCFENAIGVKREELSFDKKLIEGLGADSLDLLDLVYQLERAFDIIIPRGEIERNARQRLNGKEFTENGYLTQIAIKSIKEELPEADFEVLGNKLRECDIPMLFTVRTFFNIVERQLELKRTARLNESEK